MPDRDIEKATVRIWPVISICVTICATAIGATWWLGGMLSKIDRQLSDNAVATTRVSDSLDDLRRATYTLDHASEQALRMAIENPGTRVPDPRDPSKVIVVTSRGPTGDTQEHRSP